MVEHKILRQNSTSISERQRERKRERERERERERALGNLKKNERMYL